MEGSDDKRRMGHGGQIGGSVLRVSQSVSHLPRRVYVYGGPPTNPTGRRASPTNDGMDSGAVRLVQSVEQRLRPTGRQRAAAVDGWMETRDEAEQSPLSVAIGYGLLLY
eukprot:GHVU01012824.1.p3 GENE.GHVU01012824.1~~GHVU01012824.1.p3  ORF type:complete len:109 (-),score=9.83 GHVU01012824.1:605-931(-)